MSLYQQRHYWDIVALIPKFEARIAVLCVSREQRKAIVDELVSELVQHFAEDSSKFDVGYFQAASIRARINGHE